MTISMSISIILLLTFISSGLLGIIFRGYPGVRVLVEGVLIQLGGLLFGPFIGLLIGAITDLLTTALTAGMFHPGFFIIVLTYGIIAGLFQSTTIKFKNNSFKYAIFGSILYSAIIIALIFYIQYQQYPYFTLSIFSKEIHFSKLILIAILSSTLGIVLITVWLIMIIVSVGNTKLSLLKIKYNVFWNYPNKRFLNRIMRKKYGTEAALKQASWYSSRWDKKNEIVNKIAILEKKYETRKNKNIWVICFIQSIFLVFVASAAINVFFSPCFDQAFSPAKFDHWLVVRTLSYPIIAIINFAIVFLSYKVVIGLIKYDYNEDRIENISKNYLD